MNFLKKETAKNKRINLTLIIYFFLLLISFFFFSSINYTFALETNLEEKSTKEFIDVKVPAAVVIDSKTGRVLFAKNEEEKRPMASLTKIMTSILLVENCDMNEEIEVPAAATWIGGSEVGLKKGDKVTAKSLLYGMMLPSGNDCAYTVGIHLGGTIENFAVMMNKKAKEMGLKNTSFANPHGLDNENHYTTAKEMAEITRYALNNKDINEAIGTKTATINFGSFSKLLTNTNALLRTYEYADGGKTGFTNGANRCLVATATKDGNRYIAVVLGAEDTKKRFNTAKEILEASFERYKVKDLSDILNFYINVEVEKGSIKTYERKYSENLELPLAEEEIEKIYVKQNIAEKIVPPAYVGDKIGMIEVYIQDEKIYEKEVLLDENIYKKTPFDYVKEALKDIFKKKEEI